MSEQLKYHILDIDSEEIATVSIVREESHNVEYSKLKHELQVRIQTLSSVQ